MLLFFRIILIISVIIAVLFLILINSEVRIKINNLIYSSSSKKNKIQYDGIIGLYFLGSVKLINLKFNNIDKKDELDRLLKNKFLKERINGITKSAKSIKGRESKENIRLILKQLKKYVIIESLEFKSYIDTESVILTSYIVSITSSIIPFILRENMSKRPEYQILPLYKNQNYFYIQLNSIISINVVHIINMFKRIGGMSNERTSNRKFNVNCYGKY